MKTIIEMAREANEYADTNWALWPTGKRWKETRDERFAALVRAEAQAEEREACAKVAWDYGWRRVDNCDVQSAAVEIHDAIRARGNT